MLSVVLVQPKVMLAASMPVVVTAPPLRVTLVAAIPLPVTERMPVAFAWQQTVRLPAAWMDGGGEGRAVAEDQMGMGVVEDERSADRYAVGDDVPGLRAAPAVGGAARSVRDDCVGAALPRDPERVDIRDGGRRAHGDGLRRANLLVALAVVVEGGSVWGQ